MENKKRKNNEMTKENDKQFLKDGMTTADIKKTVHNIRLYLEKPGAA